MIRDRFLQKTIPEPNTGCWLWLGAIHKVALPYGFFRVANRQCYAHRVSYELFVGTIPPGVVVMHTCDVPCCVNPAHLKIGTYTENMHDMAAKGRGRKSRKGLPFGAVQLSSGRFQARVVWNARAIALGTFPTADEASGAALEFRKGLVFGERSEAHP